MYARNLTHLIAGTPHFRKYFYAFAPDIMAEKCTRMSQDWIAPQTELWLYG